MACTSVRSGLNRRKPGLVRMVLPSISTSGNWVTTSSPNWACGGKLRVSLDGRPCAATPRLAQARPASRAPAHRRRAGEKRGLQRVMVYIQGVKPRFRSEERRVGEEGRSRGAADHL